MKTKTSFPLQQVADFRKLFPGEEEVQVTPLPGSVLGARGPEIALEAGHTQARDGISFAPSPEASPAASDAGQRRGAKQVMRLELLFSQQTS